MSVSGPLPCLPPGTLCPHVSTPFRTPLHCLLPVTHVPMCPPHTSLPLLRISWSATFPARSTLTILLKQDSPQQPWCSSTVGKPRMDCVQTLPIAETGLDHGPEVQRAEGSDFFLHTDSNNTFQNHFGNHYSSHISILELLFLVTFRPQRVFPFLHYCLLVWVTG